MTEYNYDRNYKPGDNVATQEELEKLEKEVKQLQKELAELISEGGGGEEGGGGDVDLPWADPYDFGYDPIAADNTDPINDAIASLPERSAGRVLIPRGPTYHASPILGTKRKGLILEGYGAPEPTTFVSTEWQPSTLIYTGTDVRGYDFRSAHGTTLRDIGLGYNNAGFTGVLIDFGHNPSVDSTLTLLERCAIQGVGYKEGKYISNAKALVSFAASINNAVKGCRFHHAEAAIRGQEDGGAYSNVCNIEDCLFGHCFAYIVNPGQGWTVQVSTFEGLQGDNPVYPHHAILSDLAGGGSVSAVNLIGNWMGDAFGDQEWIRLKPISGRISGNFISGGLGAIRFFNNEESSIVGGGLMIDGNTLSTAKGFGIDYTNGNNIIWEGLTVTNNNLFPNYGEAALLNEPKESPHRDYRIEANYTRTPEPFVQPYYLQHSSNRSTLTAADKTAMDDTWGSTERKVVENLRTRMEELETALKKSGGTL